MAPSTIAVSALAAKAATSSAPHTSAGVQQSPDACDVRKTTLAWANAEASTGRGWPSSSASSAPTSAKARAMATASSGRPDHSRSRSPVSSVEPWRMPATWPITTARAPARSRAARSGRGSKPTASSDSIVPGYIVGIVVRPPGRRELPSARPSGSWRSAAGRPGGSSRRSGQPALPTPHRAPRTAHHDGDQPHRRPEITELAVELVAARHRRPRCRRRRRRSPARGPPAAVTDAAAQRDQRRHG